ncbi:type VI secretion system accessory protein TagJ, partial [Escherichia coli]|uniref:type VI secretion system accessory protein TagJ n=1 Tax=Escherichia coli TaxID=562 RepID=UPI0017FA224D
LHGNTHRYSGSEKAADTLSLCRETVWQDGPGETLVQARGQRVWLTSQGDISLLELSTCTFNTTEGSDA